MPKRGAATLERQGDAYARVRAGALGSGVCVDDRVVVTMAHVVDHAAELRVRLSDGSESGARIERLHQPLAVPHLDAPCGHALTLGDATALAVGTPVRAIGNPFGGTPIVSDGVVAAIGVPNAVITDAAIHFGNTGGALVTRDGALIGINDAVASDEAFDGLGIAIKSDAIDRALALSDDEPPCAEPGAWRFTGLHLKPLDDSDRSRLDLDEDATGMLVVDVEPKLATRRSRCGERRHHRRNRLRPRGVFRPNHRQAARTLHDGDADRTRRNSRLRGHSVNFS